MSEALPINVSTRQMDPVTATAGQTLLSVTFPVQRSADLTVSLTRGGVTVDMDWAAGDFTFTGEGDPSGGQVELAQAAEEGDIYQVSGLAVLDRLTAITQNGRNSSRNVDNELDRAVIRDQEQRRDIDVARAENAANTGLIEGLMAGIIDVPQVASYAGLQALTAPVTAVRVYLIGWHLGSTLGGGFFDMDPDDATSADDGGTIAVDAAGRRWKRVGGDTSADEFDFGVKADRLTSDTAKLQVAADWLSACPANGRRHLTAQPGHRRLTGKVTVSAVNKANVSWTAPPGRQAIYLVENGGGGIEVLRLGARAVAVVENLCPVPAMEGAGTLIAVRGVGSFGVGGVPFSTAIVTGCDCNPEDQETSTFYAVNPFNLERNSRPVFSKTDYRPGKNAPRVLGEYILNLSNCYAFEWHDCTLGGFVTYGVKVHHTIAVEGGALSGNRVTQAETGFSWRSATPQPGLTIGHNHFNSTRCNYDIDGVKLMTMDGGMLFANNGPQYAWTRSGNTLTCVADGGQSKHYLSSPFRVRIKFGAADVEDPDYDGDNDGTADAPPAGIYTATVVNDSTFTITDVGFGGLAASGQLYLRWSDSDFDDIRLRNAVNSAIRGVEFGGQAARNRYHANLGTAGSLAGLPSLQGNRILDLHLTARSNLSPIACGDGIKTLEVRLPGIWAEQLGTVAYPSAAMVTQIGATPAEVLVVADSSDTFDERSVGGLINAVGNGKFTRGTLGWTRALGWTISTNEAEARTRRSAARYLSPDTSNNSLTTTARIACREGSTIRMEWDYKVTAGTITTHRARADFWDKTGAVIDANGVAAGTTLLGDNDTSTPATYTRRGQNFLVPAGAVECVLGVMIGAPVATSVYVDEVFVAEPIPASIPDGDKGRVTVSNGGLTWLPKLPFAVLTPVADGATDQWAAIQAWLNGLEAAGFRGYAVLDVTGDIAISAVVEVPDFIILAGRGKHSTRLKGLAALAAQSYMSRNKNFTAANGNLVAEGFGWAHLGFVGTARGKANVWLTNAAGTVIADPAADYQPGGCLYAGVTTRATLTLTVTNGQVTAAVPVLTGAGYAYDPTVVVADATGKGCVINAVRAAGAVTSYVIADPGKGYSGGATAEVMGGGANPNAGAVGGSALINANRRNANYAQAWPAIAIIKGKAPVVHDCAFTDIYGTCISDQGNDNLVVERCDALNCGRSDAAAFFVSSEGYLNPGDGGYRQSTSTTVRNCRTKGLRRGFALVNSSRFKAHHNDIDGWGEGCFAVGNLAARCEITDNRARGGRITDLVCVFVEGSNDILLARNEIDDCDGRVAGFDGTGARVIDNLVTVPVARTYVRPYGPFAERYDYGANSAAVAGGQIPYSNWASAFMYFDSALFAAGKSFGLSGNRLVVPAGGVQDCLVNFLGEGVSYNVLAGIRIDGNDLSEAPLTELYDAVSANLWVNPNSEFLRSGNIGAKAWDRQTIRRKGLTLLTDTSAQSLLSGTGAAPPFTVRAGTLVRLRGRAHVVCDNTSKNFDLSFGGTATLTDIYGRDLAQTGAFRVATATQNSSPFDAATAFSTLTAASAATRIWIEIDATLIVNAGGTLFPRLAFSVASGGSPSVEVADMELIELGLAGATQLGVPA